MERTGTAGLLLPGRPDSGPGRGTDPDAWDGYTANRDRIVAGLVDSPVRNAVVLTGDIHSHWAAEVRESSMTRHRAGGDVGDDIDQLGGDGSDSRDEITAVLPENPHIRYFNNRRGYVRTRITPDELVSTSGSCRSSPAPTPGPRRGVFRRARWRACAALHVSPSGARNADSPSVFASSRPSATLDR